MEKQLAFQNEVIVLSNRVTKDKFTEYTTH